MFRWRHAAVVLAVYIVMGQCGGRGGDYEGYGRLAGKSEVIPSAERFYQIPVTSLPVNMRCTRAAVDNQYTLRSRGVQSCCGLLCFSLLLVLLFR